MTNSVMDEASIRKVVAERARELGGAIDPQSMQLDFMDGEAARNCRLFHASWGARETEQSLSGLIRDDEPPDTYPGQAMAKVFGRWLETEGKLPVATHAAKVAAYMFDPFARHNVIVDDEDKAKFVARGEWLSFVKLPEVSGTDKQPGIVFWWVGPNGPSEMRVTLADDGRTVTSEKYIRDFS